MEVEAPLDLSVTAGAGARLKVEYCTDDSDVDSDGHGGPIADPKAYKKSLMKRYREYYIYSIVTTIILFVKNCNYLENT